MRLQQGCCSSSSSIRSSRVTLSVGVLLLLISVVAVSMLVVVGAEAASSNHGTTTTSDISTIMDTIAQEQHARRAEEVLDYKPERIIVIGDLHGDLQQTLAALQLSEVIDHAGKWIGGATNTRLVQMGDLVDRGHQDKEVMDFMIHLKREAEADAVTRPHYYRLRNASAILEEAHQVLSAAQTSMDFATEVGLSYVFEDEGSTAAVNTWVRRQMTMDDAPVTVLLGNHEVMNLDNDLRYAAPESNIPFYIEEEERRLRETAGDNSEALIAAMHDTMVASGGGLEGAKAYYSATSEGGSLKRDALAARRRMFKGKGSQPGQVGGKYGTFFQVEAKLIHIYNDSVFVHAGLKPQFARYGLEKLNSVARSAIEAKATFSDDDDMSLYQSPIFASDGPVWTRDLVGQAQSKRCTQLQSSLDTVNVNRMFVGHTPQRDLQIGSYCEGKFIVTDVGISRWMYGGLSTVEIISKHEYGVDTSSITAAELADMVEVRVVDPSDLSERAGREMDRLEEKGGVDHLVLEELIQALSEAEKTKRRSGRAKRGGGGATATNDEL